MAYVYADVLAGTGVAGDPYRPAHEHELAADPSNYQRHYRPADGTVLIASDVRLPTYEDLAEDADSDVELLDEDDLATLDAAGRSHHTPAELAAERGHEPPDDPGDGDDGDEGEPVDDDGEGDDEPESSADPDEDDPDASDGDDEGDEPDDVEAPFDPSTRTIDELEAALEDAEHSAEELAALRAAEADGEERVGALDVVDDALEAAIDDTFDTDESTDDEGAGA